jgi:hypothetical protein
MRGWKIMGLALLLGMMVIPAARAADAEPATRPSSGPAEEAGWSETLNGLRVRLRAPDGGTFREKSLMPLFAEVQNDSDKPIPYGTLWPTVRVLARDAEGKWLGIPAMGPEVGDWATRPCNLEPRQVTTLKFAFQSLRFNRPLKVGEKIELQVGAPTQRQRAGQLPLEVHSPPLSVRIENAFPRTLAEADVAGDWQIDLACRVEVGFLGSQTVHVDAQGNATLVQNTQRNGVPVVGRLSVALPAERLAELAAALRKMEVWKLDEAKAGPPAPDAGSIRIALVSRSGGSLVGEFQNPAQSEQPIVRDVRQWVEGLIQDIETRATATPK